MITSTLRTVCCAAIALGSMQAAHATLPAYDHVVVVIMENHALGQVIGSASAPNITSLASQGANFTNSHGVTHPSQPNYIALFSGSPQGVTNDTCPKTFTGVNNLGAQVIASGRQFTGYSESMPSVGYLGCTSGQYARKHNPWSDFPNVPTAASKPFTSFPTAANYATLPALSFVVPNLTNDMHDGTVNQGDLWIKANIDAYAQWAKTHNSLLILTFDEDDSATSANLIPTMFVGANVVPGTYNELINHYNILATIESIYGLPSLTTATPISDVFGVVSGPNTCNATVINGAATTCTAAGLPGYTGTAYTHVYSTYTGGGACTQAPAPGFDTSACSLVTGTALTNNVPVTGIAVAAGAGKTYTFVVPVGATNLLFKTTGGTGDADLYIKLGSAPTSTSYLQKSDGSTTTETIAISAPVAGTYYVLVQGYAASSGIALLASYLPISDVPPNPANGVPVTGIAVAAGASQMFNIVVPAGRPTLTFKTSGGTGDADLYVQLNSAPTTTSFLKSSEGSTTAETITITSPAAGTYYVMVHGYVASSGITLLITF